MRLVSYTSTNGPRVAGITAEGAYVDLNHANPGLPTSMTELLAMGRDGLCCAGIAIERENFKFYFPLMTCILSK